MTTKLGELEAIVDKTTPLLISSRAASRLLGVDPKTFNAITENNDLQGVSTGRTTLWPRLAIERLAALKESA
jgi:hypothetical protein